MKTITIFSAIAIAVLTIPSLSNADSLCATGKKRVTISRFKEACPSGSLPIQTGLQQGSLGVAGVPGPKGDKGDKGDPGLSAVNAGCFEVTGNNSAKCEEVVSEAAPSFYVAFHTGAIDLTNSAPGMCVLDAIRPVRRYALNSGSFGGSSGGTGPIVGVSYSSVCNSAASCAPCSTKVTITCCPIVNE